MDLAERMDSELVGTYEAVPAEGLIDWEDLPATREFFAEMMAEMTRLSAPLSTLFMNKAARISVPIAAAGPLARRAG